MTLLTAQVPVSTGSFDSASRFGVSETAIACAIWAIVLGRYSSSADLLFGAGLKTIQTQLDESQTLSLFIAQLDRQLSTIAPNAASVDTAVFMGKPEDAPPEQPRLTLALFVQSGHDSLTLRYDPRAFPEQTALALAQRFAIGLEKLPAAWNAPVRDLRLTTPQEERQILVDWNQTSRAFQENVCVHRFFEDQAARTPDAPAILFRDARWTYRELDTKANALAQRLQQAGVGRGALVAVSVQRSPELLMALLAVLKTGAAYVPLDPSYPPTRLAFMLEDARPAAIVVSSTTATSIPKCDCPMVDVANAGDAPFIPGVDLPTSEPAYVIYTSGSTGNPKGVIVTHRNVANFFAAMDEAVGSAKGIWLAVTSVSFDISVFELFWTLARGFAIVIQEEGQLRSGGAGYSIPAQIRRHGVTHLQCTPSLASMLVRDADCLAAIANLKCLMVGGEALSLDLGRKLASSVSGAVYNMYGPTETTIWSLVRRIKSDEPRIMIGRPIANTQLYILDQSQRLVPACFPGELYIGGDGVAASYLRRPELTAEKFVANPFDSNGSPLYRTGDIVRYVNDGSVEFIGRSDQQIKIRGFRIELGEIETALRENPQVRDALVVVRHDPQNADDKRLAAYIIPTHPTTTSTSEIRSWLRAKLPAVMVPQTITLLDQFPRTPNGKLDKNALPAPAVKAEEEIETPANDFERRLAAIWAEVLDVKSVPLTRPFFDLGGHSLLMVEVKDRIQDSMDIDVPLVDLFRYPTVRSLAATLAKPAAESPTASGSDRGRLRQQANLRRAAIRPPPSPHSA